MLVEHVTIPLTASNRFTILGDRWFRLNRHLGAQKIVAISHPETITTTPLLQLDYDSTLWSSNSTMDQDSIFHRRVNITQAKFFPTSRLYKHALEAMNKRPQFESSTRLNGSTAFWAPVLKCASANDSVIADATRTWGRGISWKPPSYMSYAAWVPGDWVPGDDANRWSFLPEKTIDDESLDTKRIFILTNSGDTQKTAGKIYDSQILTVNVTECILGNATLTYNFDNASTKVSNWSLPFAYHHHRLTEKTAGELISYTALMNAFGNILVGSTYPGESPDSFPDNPEWKHLNIDWTRAEEVRRGLESFFTNITITLLSDPGFT